MTLSRKRGEITAKIQKLFFEITSGERPAPGPWLTYVHEQEAHSGNGFGDKSSVATPSSPVVEPATKIHAAAIK